MTEEKLKPFPDGLENLTTKEVAFRFGLQYGPIGYPPGTPSSDAEATSRISTRFVSKAKESPSDEMLRILLQSAGWARDGFHQILVGHKQAAALMVTAVSEDMVEHVHMPWPSLYIEIPPDLLSFDPDPGTEARVRIHGILANRIEVSPADSYIFLMALVDGNFVSLPGRDFEYFARGTRQAHWDDNGDEKASSVNVRTTNLLLRLFVNVCMAMTSPDNYSKRKSAGWGKKKRQESTPQVSQYILRMPVKFDFRPALSSFVHNRQSGRELSVQFLVSGHWRRQACGPNRSERKTIWIEPFWKGPEAGSIAISPRIVE